MVGDLIHRISDSVYSLSLHSDEGYYLQSFSNKFTATEKKLLFRFDISQALKHTNIHLEDYLYFTYGVYDTRALNNDHFGQLLSELFIDYETSEIKQNDVANVLSKPNNLTDSPAFCASVLSKRSFHEVCISHVLADAKDLAFDADNNPRLDDERSFDDIINEFWSYVWGENRSALACAWTNYGRFLEKVNVEHKHPLYATNYALALTPTHQELISSPHRLGT